MFIIFKICFYLIYYCYKLWRGSSKLLFPSIYRVDTCFCFDIRIRFFNFPLPTCFYLRSPLFYIFSWIIYYPKSNKIKCLLFLQLVFILYTIVTNCDKCYIWKDLQITWSLQRGLSSKLQSAMRCAQCLSWILDSNWFWFL
jgi:hypothetical protein